MSVQSAHNSPVIPASGQGLRIGVFDSGVGGLSVLRAIRRQLPLADLIYVADSANAPYGERDNAFILQRSATISRFLLSHRTQAIVVACNTATAAAVHHLRMLWPHMPIVGVEPGLKPAVAVSCNKRIGVMATSATLASTKFQRLMNEQGGQAKFVLQPCPGLAAEIEKGLLDTSTLRSLVDEFTTPLRAAQVDTVVLGCTHYPFVRPLIEVALGKNVKVIDTADAVARHVARQVFLSSHTCGGVGGDTWLWSSGNPNLLTKVVHSWLGLNAKAQKLPQ